MPIETTVDQLEYSLTVSPAINHPLAGWFRHGWILGEIVLTGLLVWYLVGLVDDYQRIQGLVAEPTPPSKVITKNEAWKRIYSRAARYVPR